MVYYTNKILGGINMLTRKCDLCNNQAEVDTKTIYGYWAYLCPECNKRYGTKAFQTKLANLSEGGSI